MLMKSLFMRDFRQFKGRTHVNFSCDPDKNVTIILGDNTFGKTTLLQAFNWCFYGRVHFDQNPDKLLNYEVESEMANDERKTVEVEITLIHSNIEYIISRSQVYVRNGNMVKGLNPVAKVSYKQPDGQTESVRENDVPKVINNILPEDLSTYFFFDTERVNSISTRKDVADAVKGLLGLTTLDNAIGHLGDRHKKKTVIGIFYGSMDLDGDSRARDALNKIQTAEQKREAVQEQLEECDSQVTQYTMRKEQLDGILRENQATTTLQKKKEDLERRIRTEQKALNDSTNGLVREFGNGSTAFFAQPLLTRAEDFLKEVKIDDKGIRDLTRTTLMELLKRGRCVCGQELKEGTDAYQHIVDELSFVPPESIGNTVRHYREKLRNFSKNADQTYANIEDRYREIFREKTRIQEWEDEIQDISAQISGKESMKKYEQELVDIKNRLKDLNVKRDRLTREDGAQKKEIDTFKKIYDSLTAASGKNREMLEYIEYAEVIRDWMSERYKTEEASIRGDLQEEVNKIFERMYHGHRRVSIDTKYRVELLTSVADKEIAAGESEGSNRVKNFAFIAGLVALAKQKIEKEKENEEFGLTSEPYPLVMDAPFSNADEVHTANISKVLPEIADQVIMFVMKKDWNYAEPVMCDKVGKSYQLNKISETHTLLR